VRLDLAWPGFQVSYEDHHRLKFSWTGTGLAEFEAECCAEASLRPRSADGSGQLVFRFRGAQSDAADLTVLRVGVPAAHVQDAGQLVQRLRREHGVPDRQDDEDEAAELARVPAETDGWVLAPTGPASEELYDEVMERIENDTD
jgi:hypothetical protein